MSRNGHSAWGAIVKAITGKQAVLPKRAVGHKPVDAAHRTHVQLIERSTASTVLVTWHDACLGSYAEQVWRRSLAPRRDKCILSGAPIRRGDLVFRPRSLKDLGASADVMIRLDAAEREFSLGRDAAFDLLDMRVA